MTSKTFLIPSICAAALAVTLASPATGQDAPMSFFITSANPGQGGDLGGLAGADAHCTSLAETAGVTGGTWRAYLSTATENARDRIGTGPWVNAEGETVASSIEDLHGEAPNFTKETALDEEGEVVNGRGDTPNRHDILTGSGLDGTYKGTACGDWSSSGEGSAFVGHHDRTGGGANPTSWNSAHETRGCSMEALRSTGGDGLFYCFRAD